MKTIEIVGKNYFGHWTHERTACRGVIIEDGRHEDLVRNGGEYAGLWERQTGAFED